MKLPGCPKQGDRNRIHITLTGRRIIGLMIPAMLILFSTLAFVGCNGGSEGSDAGTTALNNAQAGDMMDSGGGTAMQSGRFIDSPVSGLNYHSASVDGVTDGNGGFMYVDGETMQFSIGDVVLGEAMPKDVMTPVDFADAADQAEGLDNPMVINMGRFLQSLDADADPENGITITPEVVAEVMGRMINFNQSVADFESDPFVTALFDTLNGLNMPHNGQMWELCSADTARRHMIEHMSPYMTDYTSDQPGSGSGSQEATGWDGETSGGMMTGDMIDYMDDYGGTGGTDSDLAGGADGNPPANDPATGQTGG